MELPVVMGPLIDHRVELLQMLGILERPEEAARVDIGDELVRIGAQYEDVLERALYPGIEELVERRCTQRGKEDVHEVRTAMTHVHVRTRHGKPINAHLEDPTRFERDLMALVRAFRRQLAHEDDHVIPLLRKMHPEDAARLESSVRRATEHVSTRPDPPRNRAAGLLSALKEKVDRRLNDAATMSHPGLEEVKAGGGGTAGSGPNRPRWRQPPR